MVGFVEHHFASKTQSPTVPTWSQQKNVPKVAHFIVPPFWLLRVHMAPPQIFYIPKTEKTHFGFIFASLLEPALQLAAPEPGVLHGFLWPKFLGFQSMCQGFMHRIPAPNATGFFLLSVLCLLPLPAGAATWTPKGLWTNSCMERYCIIYDAIRPTIATCSGVRALVIGRFHPPVSAGQGMDVTEAEGRKCGQWGRHSTLTLHICWCHSTRQQLIKTPLMKMWKCRAIYVSGSAIGWKGYREEG